MFSIFMHLTCLKRKIRIIVFKTELSIPLLSKAFQRLNAKIILCDRILSVTRCVIMMSFVICSEILCNSCCNNEVIDYFSPRQSILWSHAIARSCTEVLMLWGYDQTWTNNWKEYSIRSSTSPYWWLSIILIL